MELRAQNLVGKKVLVRYGPSTGEWMTGKLVFVDTSELVLHTEFSGIVHFRMWIYVKEDA